MTAAGESFDSLSRDNLLRLAREQHGKLREREARIVSLETELRWFRTQLWGKRSEKRLLLPDADQKQLTLVPSDDDREVPKPTETVRTYQRRQKVEREIRFTDDESRLRFSESVPVEEIAVADPKLEGLEEGRDYEVVSEKVTHRLAQRPAAYVVLKYIRKVVKMKGGELSSPPAPPAVIERSVADVSFLAGLMVDKFEYHLPLYRQHRRLADAGIALSRQTLTNLVERAGELLKPVYYAQLSSILAGRIIAMDETPIKASRAGPGKMRQGYFWPLYGDRDEVAFPYSRTRALKTVREILGEYGGTVLSDGYAAYKRYAESAPCVHAECWAHTRRKFVEAEAVEPSRVARALELIGQLYEVEASAKGKPAEERLALRRERSRPLIEEIFSWLSSEMADLSMLSSNPFIKAASYTLERRKELSVFLSDPDVQIDTNHLERALRPIPLGRKNWLFCWTEVGAEHVGRIQSLIATAKLHSINPYTYFVDVLQRIDSHPALDVEELTPRRWKELFADSPFRSDLARQVRR